MKIVEALAGHENDPGLISAIMVTNCAAPKNKGAWSFIACKNEKEK